MAILVSNVLSHWTKTFPFTSISSEEFYTLIEQHLKEQNIDDCFIGRVTMKEGGVFSSSRQYYRVKFKHLVFDICAAPFGSHFFISWWFYESEGSMASFFRRTKFGSYLQQRAAKRTFYQIDVEYMFENCIHQCITAVVDDMAESKGFRKLTNEEKIVTKGGL